MYRLHYFIGLCCYDREPGLEPSIVLVFFPYAGESEKLAVFTDDPIRSFLAIRERLPLVKTICRNKASAFGQIALERVLFFQRFCAHVNQAVALGDFRQPCGLGTNRKVRGKN